MKLGIFHGLPHGRHNQSISRETLAPARFVKYRIDLMWFRVGWAGLDFLLLLSLLLLLLLFCRRIEPFLFVGKYASVVRAVLSS